MSWPVRRSAKPSIQETEEKSWKTWAKQAITPRTKTPMIVPFSQGLAEKIGATCG